MVGLELNGNGATFQGAGTNLIASAVLDTPGGGALTNLGTGIFLLAGSNSLTSPTVLSAGTNIINVGTFNIVTRRTPAGSMEVVRVPLAPMPAELKQIIEDQKA